MRSVVIAAGIQRKPKFPPIRSRLPHNIMQIHTADYRKADDLPSGSVVVVGSGQSGCQIVEDLLSAGRIVYFCTSRVGRAPRRYRGKDILEWWVDMHFLDVTYASLEDKSVSLLSQPQISGLGRYGHSVSLQFLAEKGAIILGYLQDADAGSLILDDTAAANVHFADGFSQMLKDQIDSSIRQTGRKLPPLEDDPADLPDPEAGCISNLRKINFGEQNISTVIWATGFTGDFNWIHLPEFENDGNPEHREGVAPVPGLYFLGFPWLRSRRSGIIYGIEDDASSIAAAIAKQLN